MPGSLEPGINLTNEGGDTTNYRALSLVEARLILSRIRAEGGNRGRKHDFAGEIVSSQALGAWRFSLR